MIEMKTLTIGKNTYEIVDEKAREDVTNLSEEIGNQTGLTDEAKATLLNCFKNVAWTVSNGQDYYNALETALNASGSSGDDSGNTEATLTSISATYTGGDVTVGTALTDLTGIAVTGHYSDGSTANVTGYTLSGTIAEGTSTITVSYGGKTTTFTVTGVAESSGGEETGVSNETTWTDGVPYTFASIPDEYPDKTTGEIKSYGTWTRTPYLYCEGATSLRITTLLNTTVLSGGSSDNAFYDSDKNYVGTFEYSTLANKEPGTYIDIPIPENASYFILSGGTGRFADNNYNTYPDGVITLTPIA